MLSTYQNSTMFLRIGGAVLLIVGLVGYIGVLNSVDFFSLDAGENLAHTALGIIGLAAGFGLKDRMIHRGLTAVVGITALIFGLPGWFLPSGGALTNGAFANPNFLGLANLESPSDNLLHLFVAAWAIWAMMGDSKMPVMAPATAKKM
ncbi:MAG TPA: hypothetical protein VEU77_10625 [Candidatus Acidoferrales bacterium]|nr:hypothetical protein [Candidatus Acidoferrales bacterium]